MTGPGCGYPHGSGQVTNCSIIWTGDLNIQCPLMYGRNTSISFRHGWIMDGFFFPVFQRTWFWWWQFLQQSKSNVYFCEMHWHINVHTAYADVCVQNLRESGEKRASAFQCLISKKPIYMWTDPCSHTLIIEGRGGHTAWQTLGSWLNVASSIMQAMMDAILSKDETIWWETSEYIDNIYINENITSAVTQSAPCVTDIQFTFQSMCGW